MAERRAVEIWSEAMEAVERSLGQTDMCLRLTRAESLTDGVLCVIVPNVFTKDVIEEEHLKQIHSALRNITGTDTEVKFIIQAESWADQSESTGREKSSKGPADVFALNPKYTFDSFVVGPSNRFSYTASLAVAESPAKVYNPLYIYGSVGLGKTHLMHAIGNSIKDTNKDLKVSYMSSEEFTNEMIDLTSDSHPRDIPALEERLRSRFEWGLITIIETPEVETRIAILRKKSEELGINHLPDDVAMFIADRVTTNIRELEGCLIRALALADLDDSPLSIDLVKEALKDIMPRDSEEYEELITAESIQKIVAKHFNVRLSDLRSKKRHKTFTLPRHVAMYLCRRLTNLSLIDIGRDFGRKDHTTVIHACSKIEESMQDDPSFEKNIEQLIEEIKSYQG